MQSNGFRFLLFVFISVLSSSFVQAQFGQPCVDSNRVDPFFQCNDPSFLPVCGCNGKTYRNECVAFRNGGVNLISHDGVCVQDYFFADLFPNQVADNIDLYLQFNDKGPVIIQVRNTYGTLLMSENHLSITSRQFTYDVSGYVTGVYFVFVISGDFYQVLKFVKT